MNELSQTTRQLPNTIEEKAAYVLFGSDALNAYRKKLKAIQEKFGISSEQYKQIQLEAQETAENLLLFSVDIGNEMKNIEQAPGTRTDLKPLHLEGERLTKAQTIQQMGFTKRQAENFQTLANHPDEVQDAIKSAREHGDIVTRSDVFKRITDQYDKRKREEKELREAKHRAEDYQTDDGKITDFGKVKQHKEDNSLIFQEFADEFRKMYTRILRISGNIEEDITMNAIKAADVKDLKKIADDLMYGYRCILKIQKKIAEVIDEK